jgi:hypothetical protein
MRSSKRFSLRVRNRIQCLQSQASARARRNALSRALRVSVPMAMGESVVQDADSRSSFTQILER